MGCNSNWCRNDSENYDVKKESEEISDEKEVAGI